MDGPESYAAEGLELLDVGVAIFDPDTRLVFANPAFRALRRYPDDVCREGVTLEALLRFNAERGDFGPGDADAQVAERLAEIDQTEAREIEREMADGQILRIRYRRTDSGGLVVTFDDRTAERRAQAELVLSEERHALVSQATSDFIYDWNVIDDRLYASESLSRRFDLEFKAKSSDAWMERVHKDDYERYAAAIQAHFRGDTDAVECEYRVRGKEGGYRWIQDRGIGVRDKDGRVIRLVGAVRDVTEMKAIEQEAQAARERFEEAIEAISSGFTLWDPEDRLVIFNSRFREYFPDLADIVTPGILFRELIRAAIERGLFPGAEKNPDAFLDATVGKRARAKGEIREQYLAGGLWLQISDHRTADGGLVSIYTDITQLKEREAEITRARDEAEAALADLQKAQQRLIQVEKMASLGQLTAGIAHEIKNPLNFVNNFAKLSDELLGELSDILEAPIAALDPEARDDAQDLFRTVRENLGKINQHGNRADSIVKNMLLHSREGPSERQTVNLNAIAEEALGLAYHGARAEHPGFNIEMIKTLGDAVGEVECFPQDMMRVFLNLITNGMYAANKRGGQAGDGFSPTISITTRVKGAKIEIEVRDNGGGIAPEVREKIFIPFFTTKPAGEGTGLGLSLSYDIVVKQHGGELTVDSEPGEFTAFLVTIPRTLPASEGDRR